MCTFENDHRVLVCDLAIHRVREAASRAFGDAVQFTPVPGEGTLVEVPGCMNDSAGKFCPDKWTRKEEEGRVEGKGDEELPHEDEKENQDVTARPTRSQPIPDLTSRIAQASFPKGTLAMQLRDALGSIYQDADFVDLFPKRGRAAEAPWRLALVTVLHPLENLSDRQAAERCGDGGLEICAVLAAGWSGTPFCARRPCGHSHRSAAIHLGRSIARFVLPSPLCLRVRHEHDREDRRGRTRHH